MKQDTLDAILFAHPNIERLYLTPSSASELANDLLSDPGSVGWSVPNRSSTPLTPDSALVVQGRPVDLAGLGQPDAALLDNGGWRYLVPLDALTDSQPVDVDRA